MFEKLGDFFQRAQAILWAAGVTLLALTLVLHRFDLSWAEIALTIMGVGIVSFPFGVPTRGEDRRDQGCKSRYTRSSPMGVR